MANILVVADHPYVRQLVLKALTIEGHHLAAIDNAKATWRAIKERQPDIVLIDRLANGFNGFELFLTTRSKFPDLPIVIYVIKSLACFDKLKQAVCDALEQNRLPRPSGVLDGLNPDCQP
ncbi:MAG: response regulator [Desulfobacterales bacterium]|nr:MAG: response regulator [Desulfobacterales bacterium]